MANLISAAKENLAALCGLEPGELHLYRVGPQHERGTRVRPTIVGDKRRVDSGRLITDRHGRTWHRRALCVSDHAADRCPVGALGEEGRSQTDGEAKEHGDDPWDTRVKGARHISLAGFERPHRKRFQPETAHLLPILRKHYGTGSNGTSYGSLRASVKRNFV